MYGLKVWMCAAVVGLFAAQAQAQTYIVPTGTVGFPVVAGPVYGPVPVGVRYAPAYQYVTPVTYSAPVMTPIAATEVVPTPVGTSTVITPAPMMAPTPIVTGYAPQTTYYAPTVVTPITPVVVRPYPRVSVFPRRGVVRVRY